jgi:RNA polymerase sigma-70 factor (ECF subfamily)
MTRGNGCTESQQVRLAQSGDDAAFGSLCRPHQADLRAMINARISPAVRKRVSASDILQETLLAASRRLADFEYRGEGSFRAWLARIAELTTKRAVQQHTGVAKRRLDAERTRAGLSVVPDPAADGPTASHAAMQNEMMQRVDRALKELPADHRVVIELLDRRHLSIAQTAEHMGRSRNAIKKLHARALASLMEYLREEGDLDGSL